MTKNKKFLIILGSIILIILFGLAIYYFVFLKAKNDEPSGLTIEERKAILRDLKESSKEVTVSVEDRVKTLENLKTTSPKKVPTDPAERKALLDSLHNQ